MKVQITIDCGNAAFEEAGAGTETADILRKLATRIDGHPHFSPGHSQPLRDTNGNTVGELNIYQGDEGNHENNA